MKPLLLTTMLFFVFSSCSSATQQKKEEQTVLPQPVKRERILAQISKMEIPRVEKQTRQVRVLIWGTRPHQEYGREEIEITSMETGYEIRIWLLPEGNADSLEFQKTVDLDISTPGGHDIQAIGRNETLTELVFIDEEGKIQ